tara:strand:+ start:65 stop:328 length:264 start_codon:yes stop_codon:yes gene_type:complete
MELVEDKRHIKFISHPMPIFVHEETDELKTIDNSNKLSTKNINVTKLYQYELFSNLNKKINLNSKRNSLNFIIIILIILLLFFLLIN